MRSKLNPPPVGDTTFARWLDAHDLTPFLFHKMAGLAFRSIRRLAGVSEIGPRYFTGQLLVNVSRITGITIETLVEDAEAALADPAPTRKYERKAAAE